MNLRLHRKRENCENFLSSYAQAHQQTIVRENLFKGTGKLDSLSSNAFTKISFSFPPETARECEVITRREGGTDRK